MISTLPRFVERTHWRELSPEEGRRRYRFILLQPLTFEIEREPGRWPLTKKISFRDKHSIEWARFDGPKFTVAKDYAWNGNSPKRHVPLLGWIGTPDCRGDEKGFGGNILASCLHDAMRQFARTFHFPISVEETDICFYDINRLCGFPAALPYFSAVRAAHLSGVWRHKPDGEQSVLLHP